MKKNQIKLTALASAMFMLLFAACSDDDTDKITTMPADEAKQEIRDASQDIESNINQMAETPGAKTFDYFFELLGEDPVDFKSITKQSIKASSTGVISETEYFAPKTLDFSKEGGIDDIDPEEDTGIWVYDYTEYDFVLDDPDVNYLEFRYPADQEAFDNENNNASLFIYRYESIIINEGDVDYEEVILSALELELTVDNTTLLSVDFELELDQNDEPTYISLDITMAPYNFNLSFSRTGPSSDTTISASMSLSFNNDLLFGFSLNATGDMDKDAPDIVSGYIQATPIKFDGSVYMLDIENHVEGIEDPNELDIDYLNSKIDIDVIHTELNRKLGHIEVFMGIVDDVPMEEPDFIIVYQDGSWEFLHEAMPELAALFEIFEDDEV